MQFRDQNKPFIEDFISYVFYNYLDNVSLNYVLFVHDDQLLFWLIDFVQNLQFFFCYFRFSIFNSSSSNQFKKFQEIIQINFGQ